MPHGESAGVVTNALLVSSASDIMTRHQIRRARRAAGLTQAELAQKLNVTPVTVSRWENGVSRPLPVFERLLKEIARGKVPKDA